MKQEPRASMNKMIMKMTAMTITERTSKQRGHRVQLTNPCLKNKSLASKEDCLVDKAMSILDNAGGKKKARADEAFGQNIGLTDDRNKEFAKVQIQEILFKAQFGLLETPSQTQRDPALPTP